MPRPYLLITLALSAAVLLGGCSSGTKAGGDAAHAITLTMQTPDAGQADAAYFAREVAARTHGRVKIVVGSDYSSSDPANELRLVRDLREAKAQLAYVPSRAWERDERVLGFRALQAPFLVTGYSLLHAVVTGQVGRDLLATLDRGNVVGLGLVPAELRRVLARRPLASPSDFAGARIRIPDSPTTDAVLRALGARPMTGLSARAAGSELAQKRLDGVESATQSIVENGYAAHARYMAANLPLFAKTQTIAASKRTFDALGEADQAALRAAAQATAAHSDPGRQERSELKALCEQGLTLVTVSAADAAGLRSAAEPVYRMLERDAATRRALAGIERLAGQQGGGAALPACAATRRPAVAVPSSFPTGTYETILTRDDVRRAGFSTENAHREQLTFRKDGTWTDVWFGQPPPGHGHYRVERDVVTLTPANPDVLKWSYYRGLLRFRIISVPDSFASFTYTAHPWRKVK